MSERTTTAVVTDRDGIRGIVLEVVPVVDRPESMAVLETEAGGHVAVPATLLKHEGGEAYTIPASFVAREAPPSEPGGGPGGLVIPVIEEQLEVARRRYETERVRVDKTVSEHDVVVDEPSSREELDVNRVERYEVVDGPMPPRQFGNEMIIFLVEEEVVVTKRFVLKEEIHIRKRVVEGRTQQRVVLRKEEATVERVDPAGRPET